MRLDSHLHILPYLLVLGALILFATVQITMLTYALVKGTRFSFAQWFGFAMALVGLVYLFLPGISAPPLFGALLMVIAGGCLGYIFYFRQTSH